MRPDLGTKPRALHTDPLNPDTDGDGLTDGEEVSGEKNTKYGNEPTDPTNPDSDGDGLCDLCEIDGGTNPNAADTDGDGLTDGDELSGNKNTKFGNQPTDPLKADTDGDGVNDGDEIAAGTDPNVAPKLPATGADVVGTAGLAGVLFLLGLGLMVLGRRKGLTA